MKKPFIRALILLFCILNMPNSGLAQSSGIHYQAVAREGNQVLSNTGITVDLTISNQSSEAVWQETHQVQTNEFGLFTLAIGTDPETVTFQVSDEIADLDWAVGGFSLEISIDGNSIGASPIHAVPVALYGKDEDADPGNELQSISFDNGTLTLSNSGGSVDITDYVRSVNPWVEGSGEISFTGGNLGVGTSNPESVMDIASASASDSPIFQVKNHRGNPVFAVYHDSVRVFVDESAKGIKGGFAVGGYTSSKGPGQEFIKVTGENTRIYFDENAKGLKGGFAVGGYTTSKAPASQLVSIEPDNYLIGHSAGTNLTGFYNQIMGFEAGQTSTSAYRNVYLGYQAAQNTTTGDDNVYIGYRAGQKGSDGYNNVFIGNYAGRGSAGSGSVYIGDNAGANASGGWANVFIGQESGYNNTAIGGTQGARNVFIGREAGRANTTGGDNTYIGTFAGSRNVTGQQNVIIGTTASNQTEEGSYNFYGGWRSGYTNAGNFNVVLGNDAGSAESNYTIASDYDYSVMLGARAGYSNTTGDRNTFVGYRAGYSNTTGYGNVYLGYRAGENETRNNKLYIANSNTSSTEALIFGDFAFPALRLNGNVGINTNYASGYGLRVSVPASQTNSYAIVADGNMWATSYLGGSDERMKKNIVKLENSTNKLKKIRGVAFDWNPGNGLKLPSGSGSIGVLAQEVEVVFPELVHEGVDGFKAVNYDGLIPVLIEAVKEQDTENEELRQQLAVQQEMIESLKKRLEVLERN